MAQEAPDYYYSHTLAQFTRKLVSVERIENAAGRPTREHLAWMVQEMCALNRTSISDAVKAGRWIGWMLLAAEMHGFWSNQRSRDFIRADRAAGFDLPVFNKTV